MSSSIEVAFHPSQFPFTIRAAWQKSLRTRRLDPRLHYLGTGQSLRWLALHERLSPAATAAGLRVYQDCFQALTAKPPIATVSLVGLGVGGGWKEAQLVRQLNRASRCGRYVPVDVSADLVFTAAKTMNEAAPDCPCHPLVADLAQADDLPAWLDQVLPGESPRWITCFGILPVFDSDLLAVRLNALIRPQDRLLLSANLAPGDDYAAGVAQVLPQYDNPATRDWLLATLREVGFKPEDGTLEFSVELADGTDGLRRIVGDFRLIKACAIELGSELFEFAPDEFIRVFQSHRHTPGRVRDFAAQAGLKLDGEWIDERGEEGVFLLARG